MFMFFTDTQNTPNHMELGSFIKLTFDQNATMCLLTFLSQSNI